MKIVKEYALGHGGDWLLTIEREVGFWKWKRTVRFQVLGSGTVWHYWPSGKRCETFMESAIVDALVTFKYREFANA